MEFDKNKILTAVTTDQLKDGQMGWIGDYVGNLEIQARDSEPSHISLSKNDKYPFMDEYKNCSLYFYPAPEHFYTDCQAQWVKENNVKVCTKVRVTRTFTEDEDGSCCFAHNDLVGMTGSVCKHGIHPNNFGVTMSDGNVRAVPYFALEVIKEPTYRPFANAEEFKPYREKWCLDNLKGRFKIDWHSDTHIYEYGNSFITWEEAFEKYKFEDGTPFGVKEEV